MARLANNSNCCRDRGAHRTRGLHDTALRIGERVPANKPIAVRTLFRAGDLAGLVSGDTAARANVIATPQRGRREDTEPMDNIVRIAFIGLAVLLAANTDV